MSKYANILGKTEESHYYAEKTAGLRKAFNDKFFNKKQNLYDNGSETSTVLALGLGLAEKYNVNKLFENLNNQISTVDSGHACTGLIGCQWLMRTLNQNGRPDLAYTTLTRNTYPSFGYMIKKGATTIWELWNGDTGDPSMNSQNHVMLTGDILTWMYEDLAGIKSDEKLPGFKKIIMNPQILSDMKFVNTSHESPYGHIGSYLKQQNHRLIWKVDIPVNSTADIYLPCSKIEDVSESGTPLNSSEGVHIIGKENGRVLITVGSGSYSFEISNSIKIVSAPVIYRNKITGQTELISADSNCEIHYTTDGSKPDRFSPKYDKAFNQIAAAVIRAKTFSAEGLESVETKAVLNQLSVFPPNIVPDKLLVEEPGNANIELTPQTPGTEVYYTLDGSNPTDKSTLYKNPILINRQTTVKAVAMKKGWAPSSITERTIFFTLPRKAIQLEGGVDRRYNGGGEDALIDNKRGTDDYKDGAWQGFEGRDIQADIDLGKPITVNQVTAGFLLDQNAWIFLPEEVEVYYSENGKDFIPLKKIDLDAKEPSKLKQIKNITLSFNKINTRYIRVRAKNIKTCPEWHKGAGGNAWLFADEILIR
ncbi:MAG: FN3 associated domain-containing protein [Ignavibacteriaceae bacterium]